MRLFTTAVARACILCSMKRYFAAAAVIALLLGGVYFVGHKDSRTTTKATTPAATNNPNPKVTAVKPTLSGFDKTHLSTTNPASLWVVVNKQHPLDPKTYVPSDLVTPNVPLRVPGNETMQLRSGPATALETMFAAAKTDNLNLMISSGYRSYNYQVRLYGGYVSSLGQSQADIQSARPGFSEHQTGLALDIEPASKNCELAQCFAQTPEGQWLVANAYKYGFILRYTDANQSVTGYEGEPWHYRYVGVELATEMHTTHVATLEQFFTISGGTSY
jgi:D-alanyl-D-alanine carboxypeptidase